MARKRVKVLEHKVVAIVDPEGLIDYGTIVSGWDREQDAIDCFTDQEIEEGQCRTCFWQGKLKEGFSVRRLTVNESGRRA